MKFETDACKLRHQSTRRRLLELMGMTLLVGCDDMIGKEKKKSMIDPDHDKQIEKNGQKYRIFVVGGTRFLVPDVPQYTPANTDGVAGFDLNLAWPDIPLGKSPNTKIEKSLPDSDGNQTTNLVVVQVHERPASQTGDGYQSYSHTALGLPSRYVFKDDTELRLRMFASKDTPNFFNKGYSLDKEVITPFYHDAVLVDGGFISFLYTPNIHVRIIMYGWQYRINPNWKDVYLGVVETLNNYREEAKK